MTKPYVNLGGWVNLWTLIIVIKMNLLLFLLVNIWYLDRNGSMLFDWEQIGMVARVYQFLAWVLIVTIVGCITESLYNIGKLYYDKWRETK